MLPQLLVPCQWDFVWSRICIKRKVNSKVNSQDWREDIVFVTLLQTPLGQDKLQRIIDRVRERVDCDVIVDFSGVETAGGAMFTQLLELRELLQAGGHMMILCGVAPATRGVFTIARLDEVFDFVKDRFAALAHFQTMG